MKGRKNIRSIKGGIITVSNHIHNMDATMNALASFPRRPFFITLKSNFEIPISGFLVRALGGVPIPETKTALRKFNKDIEEALDKGKIIHYYPEAALWPYYHKLRPFKNGAFRLAVRKNVPIVPIIFTFKNPKGFMKLIKKKPYIRAIIEKPIYPTDDSNTLKEMTYEVMKNVLEQS